MISNTICTTREFTGAELNYLSYLAFLVPTAHEPLLVSFLTFSLKDRDRLENEDDISNIPVALVPTVQHSQSTPQSQIKAQSQVHTLDQSQGAKTDKSARVRPRSMRRIPSEAKGFLLGEMNRSVQYLMP